ncbi:ABC transporter ATP-binding protein/permease [Sphaerisporangium sp. NBC_01403]|uniref:ABC transporter ATP-binding protein n=1 Tax=Sphaerisporangium sp. NBC_01403 TaxID=2903599 RepID=UPI0032565DFC
MTTSSVTAGALAGHRGRGLAAITAVALARTAVTLTGPLAVAAAVDAALAGRPTAGPLLQLGVLYGAGTLLAMAQARMMGGWSAGTIADLRRRLVTHTLSLTSGLQRFAPGDLTSRLLTATTETAMIGPLVVTAVTTTLTALGGGLVLWYIDAVTAVVLLLGVGLTLLLVRRFVSATTTLAGDYQKAQGDLAARLADVMAGVRTVRACGMVDREKHRVLQPLPRMAEAGRAMWRMQRSVLFHLDLIIPALRMLTLGIAGYGVAAGRVSPGQLLAAVAYAGLALQGIALVEVMLGIARARAGSGRLGEVLSTEPPDRSGTATLPAVRADVEFRDITVLVDGTPVLDRLDLTVPAGTSVAVVGRSGSGKSALVALVGRLRDPDHGTVLLDGVPVSAIGPAELRRLVAYAFAHPHLLGASVHDGLTYGLGPVDRADVVRAAERARIDGWVRRSSRGYDTPLADAPRSGGEAQRLGLARALIRDADVTVLDDATSSLDTVTEAEVSTAIDAALAGRTRFFVAHRAAMAARCDLVAWLHEGKIRALAPHEELWTLPEYRALFQPAESDGETS